MNQTIVIYHKGCLDGIAAAWCFWSRFPEFEYVPGVYQEKLDIERFRDKQVFLVDFSYKVPEIKQILEVCESMIILDHHKTMFEMLEELGPHPKVDASHCTMDNSGCMIAWNALNTGSFKPPQVLLHIEDRDLWKFKLNGTKEVCAALYLDIVALNDFKLFDEKIKSLPALLDIGSILVKDQERRIGGAVYSAMDKGTYWSVNVMPDITSEVGNRLCEMPLATGELPTHTHCWYVDKDTLRNSLRSIGDFDVSVLAKEYGGGGHKNAAGYREHLD